MPWEPACHSVVVWPRAVDAELQIRTCRDWVTIQGPSFPCRVPTAVAPQASAQCWGSRPVELGSRSALWG